MEDGDEEEDDSDNNGSDSDDSEEESQSEEDDGDEEEEDSESDGSDDSEEYDEAEFLNKCVSLRYAQGTRTGFRQRYNHMIKWLTENHPDELPLHPPYSPSLCIRWCHYQMKRKNKRGMLLGAGNLNAHIQMLKFTGFTAVHQPVPTALEQFFRNAHEAHKRTVMKLVDECKQDLPDSHAQNASWPAVEYAAEKTHDWEPGRGHDTRTNLFLTGAIQTISRGERVGKVPMTAFRMGNTGDHICAGEGLSSKTDQKGLHSYDKRFWANYANGKLCQRFGTSPSMSTKKSAERIFVHDEDGGEAIWEETESKPFEQEPQRQ